jgi:hypothetical protein
MNSAKVVQTLPHISCEKHGNMTIIEQGELFHQVKHRSEGEVVVLRLVSIRM